MRDHGCAGVLLGVLLGLVGGVASVHAQAAAPDTVIARFRDAQALAVDPLGRLYVADAGRDVVRVLDRAGNEQGTIGGAGTRAGEFDHPTDVDPTNGQTVWVADAGNGRLQHFSAEGLYLETVPVGPSVLEAGAQRFLDDGRDGAAVQGEGRPIAVASTSGDEVFAIDGRNDLLLRWDEQRRPERLVGSVGQGDVPQRPVALALDGTRRLYVADRAQQAVLAYDLFGTLLRRLDTPPLPDLQALTMHRGRLWIVCAGRVFVWNPDTSAVTERPVDLPTPLVDVVQRGGDLFLLTATRLYRRSAR
jgi:DNA-binding beta-propeller fold protein YncE